MRINKLMTKVLLAIVVIGIILGNLGVVNAATGSVTFTPSSQTVKAGDTVTITMAATCDAGISGVEAKYAFDSNKLELVDERVASNKWTSMGSDGLITVLDNSAETKTSGDLYKLEFKVKEGVAVNSTIAIQFTDVKLYQDGSSSDEVSVESTQTVNLTVTSNSVTPTPTPTPTPTATPTPSITPTVTPTPSVTPTNTPTVTPTNTPTVTPSNGSTNTTGREVVVFTDDDNTTNSTSKNASSNEAKSGTSVLPYTGMSSFIVIGLVLVVISSVGLYIVNRKYRGL